jgi:hypothetical protein
VSVFELSGQLGVTAEADFRRMILEQSVLIRGMRIVASQAIPVFNWCMHHTLTLFLGEFCMTGRTQLFHLLLKQTAEASNMGVVAGETVTFRHGLVLYPFLKFTAFMTGETIDGSLREALRRNNDEQHRKQEECRPQRTGQNHYCALPS